MIKTPLCIISITIFVSTKVDLKCINEVSQRPPKYYLIEKCHRSKLSTSAKTTLTMLEDCRKFAAKMRALALNFSPPSPGVVKNNCEVLKCAEVDGGLSLVNDTRFDYYSIYASSVLDVNSTCVPTVGMFYVISRKLNYTQAKEQCMSLTGVLADVITEQRTDALAQVLMEADIHEAFIGMSRVNGSAFILNNGDTIDCTTYRSWAPGHPRRDRNNKFDCVVITSKKIWMSTSCSKKLPSICEIIPNGPYTVGAIFSSRNKVLDANTTVENTRN